MSDLYIGLDDKINMVNPDREDVKKCIIALFHNAMSGMSEDQISQIYEIHTLIKLCRKKKPTLQFEGDD